MDQTNANTNTTKTTNKNLRSSIAELNLKEAQLLRLLHETRIAKQNELKSKPFTIGIMGFGRFGQFIAKTFTKYGNVIVTSRSDYTTVAKDMGITYIPLNDPKQFLNQGLDVIVIAKSILSFEKTMIDFAPHLTEYVKQQGEQQDVHAPLIVDVLSVKEHPREIMMKYLPPECDILCTHPMFGPDSGKYGWSGLRFVYERARVDGVITNYTNTTTIAAASTKKGVPVPLCNTRGSTRSSAVGSMMTGTMNHNFNFDDDEEEVMNNNSDDEYDPNTTSMATLPLSLEDEQTGKGRMERFLSIWEEEGCEMIEMTCKDHDYYSANSQFITHLIGRIMDEKYLGLEATPLDTKGFENVLKLVSTTTGDSFDLFYGLYRFNHNSEDVIDRLKQSVDAVVDKLREMKEEANASKGETA